MNLSELTREDRLRLIRFICSFAWADLEMADSEQQFVRNMVATLELDEEEQAIVEEYLKIPPAPEDVDPTDVPLEHRELFLHTALQIVGADGRVDERELENLTLFEQLLR